MSDKGRKIYNGITNIDDDIIMAALSAKPAAQKTGKKKHKAMFYVYTWGGVAAAVICLAVVAIVFVPKILGGVNYSSSDSAASSTSSTKVDYSADVSDIATPNDSAVSDAGSTVKDPNGLDDTNEWSSSTTEPNEGNSDTEYSGSEIADLGDNQIHVDIDMADVDNVSISYPGYESITMEGSLANQIVDYINNLGILTAKEDYNDVTTENYATISLIMDDGQIIEITPKYPYIFVNGEVYECAPKDSGIYKLSVLLSEICANLFGGGE